MNKLLGQRCLLALLCLGFSLYCLLHFDGNDSMYAVAPSLAGRLYSDVHYVQAPLSFYFLKLLTQLAPSGFIYPALRLSTLLAALAAVLLVARRRHFTHAWSAVLFAALCFTNYYYASAAFEVGSYALPMLFLSVATVLLLKVKKASRACIFWCACLSGLAGSSRLNHVLFVLPLGFYLYSIRDAANRRRGRFALWFGLGLTVGLLPIAIELASNPYSFYSHNVLFHGSFTNASRGLTLLGSLRSVVGGFLRWVAQGGAIALSLLGLFYAYTRRLQLVRASLLRFLLLMVLTAFVVAFSPGIAFKQYFVPVAFFCNLGIAVFFDGVERERVSAEQKLFGRFFFVSLLPMQLAYFLVDSSEVAKETGSILDVVRVNREVQGALHDFDTERCGSSVFSLSSVFVIDTGFAASKYTEAGIFWSRVAGFVPSEYLERARYAIPENLLRPNAYATAHANALLLGYYPDYRAEAELRSWAIDNHFVSTEIRRKIQGRSLELWVNPVCSTALASRSL